MARAKPKSTKSTPDRITALYRPGVREHGLKILAKSLDDAAAVKDAPAPKSAIVEDYNELLLAKSVADTRLAMADAKRENEAAKIKAALEKAEEDKQIKASEAFSAAHHAWLAATAGIEDPEITEEEQPQRFKAQTDAERRLFTTPAAWPDQFWQKLTAFEQILGDELMSGERRDSVLVLALGSIKQDILNLELLEAIR